MTPNHQPVKKGSQPAGTSHLGDSPSCGLTAHDIAVHLLRSAWSGRVANAAAEPAHIPIA